MTVTEKLLLAEIMATQEAMRQSDDDPDDALDAFILASANQGLHKALAKLRPSIEPALKDVFLGWDNVWDDTLGQMDVEAIGDLQTADLTGWLDQQLQGSMITGIKKQILETYVKPKVVEFLNHKDRKIWGLKWVHIRELLDFDVTQLTTTSIQAMVEHPLSLAATSAKTIAPQLLVTLLDGWNDGEAKEEMTILLELVGIDWDEFIDFVLTLFDAVWWKETENYAVVAVQNLGDDTGKETEAKHDFDEVVQTLIYLATEFTADPGKCLLEHFGKFILTQGFIYTQGAVFNNGLGPFIEKLAKMLQLKEILTTSAMSKADALDKKENALLKIRKFQDIVSHWKGVHSKFSTFDIRALEEQEELIQNFCNSSRDAGIAETWKFAQKMKDDHVQRTQAGDSL